MKKNYLALSVMALFAFTVSVSALPIGRSNVHSDYLLGRGSPEYFVVGVYGSETEREVNSYGAVVPLETTRLMAYIGIDLFRWCTVFGAVGTAEHTFGGASESSNVDYEFGLVANLFDKEIFDPTLFEDRLRVNAHLSYGLSSAEWFEDWEVDWNITKFALTVSVVNDTTGEKFYAPESIAIFAGPVYSIINSKDMEHEQAFGMTAGMEVFFTQHVSAHIGIEHIDESGLTGGLHIRF